MPPPPSPSLVTTGDTVTYHARLDGLGGETTVEALMEHLSSDFYGAEVVDGMGLQRIRDANYGAVVEMGGEGAGERAVFID